MDELKTAGHGLKTAVEELHDGNSAPPDSMDGEQLDFLPVKSVYDNGNAAAESGGGDIDGRGVGRPKGSKNKNTKEWQAFLLSRYPSPLIAMAEIMSRKPEDIARELMEAAGGADGAKPNYDRLLEILKMQLSCAKELAPYLHQKMPQAIDLGDSNLMTLNIFSAPAEQVRDAPDLGFEVLNVESEQNQGVSDSENEKLNAQELNAEQETAEKSALEGDKPTD